MRTKDRNQFNCYLKDAYAEYIRGEAVKRNMSQGEVMESMIDVYTLHDLNQLLVRLAQRFNFSKATPTEVELLHKIKDRIDRIIGEAVAAST